MLSSKYNLNRVKITSPLKSPVLFLQNMSTNVLWDNCCFKVSSRRKHFRMNRKKTYPPCPEILEPARKLC